MCLVVLMFFYTRMKRCLSKEMEGVWEAGGGSLLQQQEEGFGEGVSGWMNHNVTEGAVLSIHGVHDFVNPKIFQGG